MPRDIFGSKDQRGGVKPLTNREWNELNESLENLEVDNLYDTLEFSPRGLNVPGDSFFFPHAAGIDTNYTDAIVGPDREEEWYPYIDSLGMEAVSRVFLFKRDDTGDDFRFSDMYTRSLMVSVRFPTALTKAIPQPATEGEPVILSYEWDLETTITEVTFSGDGLLMYVNTITSPALDFDTDVLAGRASLITEDTSGGIDDVWAPRVDGGSDMADDFETLINNWLQVNDPAFYPQALTSDANKTFERVVITVPIARYDYADSNQLTRCVQLLFSSAVGGMGPDYEVFEDPEQTDIKHPFKSRISPTVSDTVEVGYLRPNMKDQITIYDTHDGGNAINATIDFPASQNVGISESTHVFYRIYKNGAVWTADLETSVDYIPLNETNQELFFLIGYVEFDAGGAHTWYQHAFECPEYNRFKPQNHSFEALPVYDNGGIAYRRFASGNFNYDNGVISTNPGQLIQETADRTVYAIIKIDYSDDGFPGFSDPVYTMIDEAGAATTDLQLQGLGVIQEHEWKDEHELWIRFKIGAWDGNLNWTQYMKNDVQNLAYIAFSWDQTEKFHGEDHQIPRMRYGTGRLLQGSSLYVENDGTVKAKEETEAADPREWIGVRHDGTDSWIYNTTGDINVVDPEDVEAINVFLTGSTATSVSQTMNITGNQNYLKTENDGTAIKIGTYNDLSDALALDVQPKSEGDVRFFENSSTANENNQIHMSFFPIATKRKFKIYSVTDQTLTFEGSTPGTDFKATHWNKLDHRMTTSSVSSADLGLLVEDSTEAEMFSIRNDGRIRIGNNWNVDTAAPAAADEVMAGVAGDLQNPKWTGIQTLVDPKQSIEWDTDDKLHLVGDVDTPSAHSFYGTNGVATRGWNTFTEITVVTDVQLDGSNNLQKKTRTAYVWNPGSESSWTTVTGWSTTSCP